MAVKARDLLATENLVMFCLSPLFFFFFGPIQISHDSTIAKPSEEIHVLPLEISRDFMPAYCSTLTGLFPKLHGFMFLGEMMIRESASGH